MQLLETKVTPLGENRHRVDLVYSNAVEEDRATDYVRYKSVVETKGNPTLIGIQHQALVSLAEWAREESNRLHEVARRGG
jgi:hypothetical protein